MQEDELRGCQTGATWSLTIFRPTVVYGATAPVNMNPLPAIAVYAALQRASGEPLHFPGTETRRTLHEAVDADIVGRGLLWAATSPDAADGTFNLTNGDVFCWDDVWPVIAATFGLEVGERRPMSFARDLPARDPEWSALAEEHNLDVPPTIEGFVGANSLVYADVVMAEPDVPHSSIARSPRAMLASLTVSTRPTCSRPSCAASRPKDASRHCPEERSPAILAGGP